MVDGENTDTTARMSPLEWTDEAVANLWEYYSIRRPEAYFTAQFGDRIIEETLAYVDSRARVCDYGCGAGYLLARLLEHRRAAGLDFTARSVEVALRRVAGHPNLEGVFQVGEAENLAGSFDVVYFVETVEHVLPQHMAGTFELISKLLRPGGVVICTTPNDEDLSLQEVFCPTTRKYFHRYQHVWSFNADSLSELFVQHGFTVDATFTRDFAARGFRQRLKSRLRDSLRRYNPHLVLIARSPA